MRLLEAAQISSEEWPTGFRAAKDNALWRFYRPFTGLEALQQVLGAFMASKHDHRCLSPDRSQLTHSSLNLAR